MKRLALIVYTFTIAYRFTIIVFFSMIVSFSFAQVLGGDQEISDDIVITNAAGAQHFPDVAYNSQDNTYLVVWESVITDTDLSIIEGVMVDGDTGEPLDSPFEIFRNTENVLAPEVAYNSVDNEFVVVARFQPVDEVLAQRVEADGGLLGDTVNLGTSKGPTFFDPASRARVVSIAHNATENQYIVARGDPVSALILLANLEIFLEIPSIGMGANPATAWSDLSNVYLLAYEDRRIRDTGAENLSAQVVTDVGNFIGNMIRISDQELAEESPRIAYNPEDDQFLVIWDERTGFARADNDHTDTIGQLVSVDGTTVEGTIPIEDGIGYSLRQDADYSEISEQYLVVWKGDEAGNFAFADILGRFVNRDGSLDGEIFTIFDSGDDDSEIDGNLRFFDESKLPVVATNTQNGNFLVVWEECGPTRNPLECDIRARFVAVEPVNSVSHWEIME